MEKNCSGSARCGPGPVEAMLTRHMTSVGLYLHDIFAFSIMQGVVMRKAHRQEYGGTEELLASHEQVESDGGRKSQKHT